MESNLLLGVTMKFRCLDHLQECLEKNGFTICENTGRSDYNEAEWHAYRRLSSARECEMNGSKIALWVKPYVSSAINYENCEADITGESAGLWFNLRVYMAKPDEVMSRLPEIESKLVAAWNALMPNDGGQQ
mgnify:FL=1